MDFPRLLCVMLLAFSSSASAASEIGKSRETLLSEKTSHGAFGAVSTRFSQLAGESSVLLGGRAGWIINHSFVLGMSGYMLPSPVTTADQSQILLTYGGLQLEYWWATSNIVHLNFGTLLGAGSVRRLSSTQGLQGNFILMVEPEVTGILNVSEFLQLGLGLSFRNAYNVRLANLSSRDLTGVTTSITARVGLF